METTMLMVYSTKFPYPMLEEGPRDSIFSCSSVQPNDDSSRSIGDLIRQISQLQSKLQRVTSQLELQNSELIASEQKNYALVTKL